MDDEIRIWVAAGGVVVTIIGVCIPSCHIDYDVPISSVIPVIRIKEAIIVIEYTPEGSMSWILSRDEDGDIGIDVKFRKSF